MNESDAFSTRWRHSRLKYGQQAALSTYFLQSLTTSLHDTYGHHLNSFFPNLLYELKRQDVRSTRLLPLFDSQISRFRDCKAILHS